MIAEVISVGTELTTGVVTDTNSAWLSRGLAELGATVTRHTTVDDDRAHLAEAIRRAAGGTDVLIVNGGLGPTRDDLTRFALADALDRPLEPNEQAAGQIAAFFAKLGREFTQANQIQAMIPRGGRIIENTVGTAPGIDANLGECRVFCLPGVPREMRLMFEQVIAAIRHDAEVSPLAVRALHTFGIYEADLGKRIERFMVPGRNPAVGTTASEGIISVRVVARDTPAASATELADRDEAELRALLGDLVFGSGDDTLASVVGGMLAQRGWTIATAESCTGGLVAARLTDIPGSSAYLLRGYVTYSNESKTDLVGVSPALFEACGAVSDEVARAMALGCRERSGADIAVSLTGIAGPTGGTPEKPVGLVHIGLADRKGVESRRCLLGTHLSRDVVRDRACKTALNLLRLRLSTD